MTSVTNTNAANTFPPHSSSSGGFASDKQSETTTSSSTSKLVPASTSTEVSSSLTSYISISSATQTPSIFETSSTLSSNISTIDSNQQHIYSTDRNQTDRFANLTKSSSKVTAKQSTTTLRVSNSTQSMSNMTAATSTFNSFGVSNETTFMISNMTDRTTETIGNQSTKTFKTDFNKNTVSNTTSELPTINSNPTQSGSNSTRRHVSITDGTSNVTIKTPATFEPNKHEITKIASVTDNRNQNQSGVVIPRTYTHRTNKTSVSDVTTQHPITFLSSSSMHPPTDAPTHVNQSIPDLNPTIPADCSSVLGLSIGISVTIWVLTVLCFLVTLLRMRHRWKRKLREERQRTDIWSLSTYHNTIINENFLDYKLAPSSDMYRRSDGKSYNKNTAKLKQGRLSSGALSGRSSSSYNDDFSFRQSFIRRETMNNDDRFRFKRSRSRLKRQPSSYSSDYYLQEQNPEIRPRTSTFNIGKRDKNDKHVLLNHDMLHLTGSRSLDNLEMLEIRSRNNSLSSSQNQPFYVTEL